MRRVVYAVLGGLLLLGVAGGTAPTGAQADSRTFPETGKTVRGLFLQYWNEHGGLAQQGYPISDEFAEVSALDGKSYTVQYFERAVFEWHPENRGTPYEVLLAQLGKYELDRRYPNDSNGAAAPVAIRPPAGGSDVRFFPETRHTVSGVFRQYWEAHGGLAQQGYPLTEPFEEPSTLDGNTYLVQYFERAVFEWHPENRGTPYEVLLAQLGRYRYDTRNARYLDVFEQVWRLVRDRYIYTDFRGLNWPAIHDEYAAKIKAAPSEEQAYGLISEIIVRLDDRHSHFQTPQRVQEDAAARRGEIQVVGIGASLQEIAGGRRVGFVIPGSPADRAGLRVYDRVWAVDGKRLADNPEAIRAVRGAPGGRVTLTVESPGEPAREVTLVREAVSYTYHATARRLPGTNIAYLHIPTFGAPIIARETRDELTRLAAQGPLDGLIIDVRLNGGGASDVLSDIQKLFLDGGSAGYEVTRSERRPIAVPAGQTLPALRGKPIVVLVSGLCESACEYFTVALHDRGRATVLGTATAGNTESLAVHDFADGSRLLLAEMLLQRPDGSSIEDTGFPPDVVLDVPWYRAASLEADPQVQAALRLLQQR